MTRFALALLTFPAISFAVECNVASTTTDAVTSGALQASDCKISDFFPGFINTNSANIYSVNVTRRLVLTIKLESTKFDALLYVANSSRATKPPASRARCSRRPSIFPARRASSPRTRKRSGRFTARFP